MKILNINQSVVAMVLGLGLALAFPFAAQADKKDRQDLTAQYTCGFNPMTTDRLVAGVYRASIAVRNNSTKATEVTAQLALTFPPGGTNAGSIIDLGEVSLMPGQAISYDCDTLGDSLLLPAPYVQGMLTVSGRKNLQVSATQSAINPATGQVSISVQRVFAAGKSD